MSNPAIDTSSAASLLTSYRPRNSSSVASPPITISTLLCDTAPSFS